MQLAKNHVDVGLFTNERDPMLGFWQVEVGLPFEELLPVGGGVQQHRHCMNGSVLKLNHARDPLPAAPPSGYRALSIARAGLSAPESLVDPDGNRIALVPPGFDDVEGIAVHLGVRDEDAFHRFYGEALELPRAGALVYRCGDSLLAFEADPNAPSAPAMRGPGFRYLTIQVRDVDAEHAGIVARGGRELNAPATLGRTARISFVADPDGNAIEISQRASLVGPLDS
jgi:lactoylglutathione lyase